MLAIVQKHEWAACVLVRRGASLHVANIRGVLPLAAAVEHGLLSTGSLL
jgi:hypothetical protein